MDANKTTTNWIIAGLVALVVIIGGGWLIARERSGTMATTATSTTEVVSSSSEVTTTKPTDTTKPSAMPATTATPTSNASGENITVMDQAAGASVVVAEVNVNKPSFVAIRDTRGWYPGWQFVNASQKNVTIPLKRNTVAGQMYEAVIFTDNGDGSFEIHGGDMMLVGTAGAPVSSTFKAQ